MHLIKGHVRTDDPHPLLRASSFGKLTTLPARHEGNSLAEGTSNSGTGRRVAWYEVFEIPGAHHCWDATCVTIAALGKDHLWRCPLRSGSSRARAAL